LPSRRSSQKLPQYSEEAADDVGGGKRECLQKPPQVSEMLKVAHLYKRRKALQRCTDVCVRNTISSNTLWENSIYSITACGLDADDSITRALEKKIHARCQRKEDNVSAQLFSALRNDELLLMKKVLRYTLDT
jgi:hypothetical protein